MNPRTIQLELLPWEREVLLKWSYATEIRPQLESMTTSQNVETITISRVGLNWMASDLTHSIVKKGCRDEAAFDLSERLDYAEQSGDGRIKSWY